MECKFRSVRIAGIVMFELIDTLWNVNKSDVFIGIPITGELIDTLWNVNKAFRRRSVGNISELIDTLWNVNSKRKSLADILG